MELPDDIIRLIKEYSMPVTRPDWRTLHRMTNEEYLADYRKEYQQRLNYINNHPERHLDVLLFERLVRHKNIFCGYQYSKILKLIKSS